MDNLILSIKAALNAGEEILKIYNSDSFGIQIKKDNSPLTKADKASHNIIMDELQKTPYPILSEEGKDISWEERKNWETFWLVDPLDGTKEFIKRNGEFTVNIALIENGIPILGVVYLPVTNELYFAEKSIGSFKYNIKDKSLSPKEILKNATKLPNQTTEKYTIIASRSHMSDDTKAIINKYSEIHGEVEIISCGSSKKLCLLAEGKVNLYPRLAPTMEWDTGAGQAIVLYAGGHVKENETEKPLVYNKENLLNPFFIASHE